MLQLILDIGKIWLKKLTQRPLIGFYQSFQLHLTNSQSSADGVCSVVIEMAHLSSYDLSMDGLDNNWAISITTEQTPSAQEDCKIQMKAQVKASK